jgi:hypothetical protein
MTKRWIVSGIAVVALLAATAGIAYAAGSGNVSTKMPGASGMMAACDAMHDTPAMQAMHEHMPAALQARCDAVHEQMDNMMGGSSEMDSSGMMSGSGMMGGSGTTGGSMAGHASHHPATEG